MLLVDQDAACPGLVLRHACRPAACPGPLLPAVPARRRAVPVRP
ncbi:hypothetical protein ACH4E7_44275 [Kitasatospora sp. NPDC018058]